MTSINYLMDKAETHLEDAESRIRDINALLVPEINAKLEKLRCEFDKKHGKEEDAKTIALKHSATPEKILADDVSMYFGKAAKACSGINDLKEEMKVADYLRLATKFSGVLSNVTACLTNVGLYDKAQFGKALSEANEAFGLASILTGICSRGKVSDEDKLVLGTYVLGKVLNYANFDASKVMDLVKVPESIDMTIDGKTYPLSIGKFEKFADKKKALGFMKLNGLENCLDDKAGVSAYVFNRNGPYSNFETAATMLITNVSSKPSNSEDLKSIYAKAKTIADYVSKK